MIVVHFKQLFGSNLWSCLDNVVLVVVEAALDVLRLVVIDLLDVAANLSESLHVAISEGGVLHESLVVVVDSESLLLVHGVGVEETSTCESREILRVRVRSEDETLSSESKRLVRVVSNGNLPVPLVEAETEGLAWHV